MEPDDGVVILGIVVTAIVATVSVVGLLLFFSGSSQASVGASSPVMVIEQAQAWVGNRPRDLFRRQVVYN